MNVRTTLLAASVAVLALAGCGSSDRNTGTPDSGCTTCNAPDSGTPDSGTPDSGTPDSGTPDSGTPDGGGNACNYIPHSDGGVVNASTDMDAGTQLTIAQLRYGKNVDGGSFIPFGTHALVNGVVVRSVDYVSADGGSSQFWVVDPNDTSSGFWVYHRGTDAPYIPAVNDVVNIDGFFGSDPKYYNPDGYRYNLANLYSGGAVQRQLIVTSVSTNTALTDNSVDAGCTFDAQEGMRYFSQRQQAFAGTRVHFNGPLAITNPNPVALSNVRLELDGGATVTSYKGFEVTGGILVADQNTYNKDGGFGAANNRCDWAALARSGNTVTFPDGIHGVFDTYTLGACQVQTDGGCYNVTGYVPNQNSLAPSDGGNQQYTFVLYPQTCADLPGDAGAGVTP